MGSHQKTSTQARLTRLQLVQQLVQLGTTEFSFLASNSSNTPKKGECQYLGMVVRVVIVLGVVFLLIWISLTNFQGRFFSKEGESDTFVGQGGFVNKTWFFNQMETIKEELYERISNKILSDEKYILSEKEAAVGENFSELTETVTGDQISKVYADQGDTGEYDTDNHGGHSVETGNHGDIADPGDPTEHSVETGEPKFKFSIREGQGSWSQRQLMRVRRLQNVCSRHPERSSFIESEKRRFVYDPHSNILWCQIPKTGSTTYIDAYNKIARMYGRGNFGRLGKGHSDRERVKKMLSFNDGNKEQILARNPLIFSVVRHPYERLVSAYVDFSDKPRSANELHGTFEDFLTEQVLGKTTGCSANSYCRINPHWNSQNNLCSFCALNYTGISKMETFSEDFVQMSRKLGLGIGENKVQRLHSHVGESIQQVTQRMFANLSTVVASKVEQFYSLDMKMFGYKPYPSM